MTQERIRRQETPVVRLISAAYLASIPCTCFSGTDASRQRAQRAACARVVPRRAHQGERVFPVPTRVRARGEREHGGDGMASKAGFIWI